MVKRYSATVYDRLSNFLEARRGLPRHEHHLPLIGQVICQFGLCNLVGIALLHKHFDLAEDERLIEQFEEDGTYIRPQRGFSAKDVLPYLWKVDEDEGWYPLEFCQPTNKAPNRDLTDHHDFLEAMAKLLIGLRLKDIFGLTWLHRDFITVKSDELLVETTDEPARTLTWSAQPMAAFGSQELTPTTWRFNSNGKVVETHGCGHCYHKSENVLRGGG